MRTKLVNGVRVTMDPIQEAELDAEQLDWETNDRPVVEREEAFKTAKAAALTFDEAERDILIAAYNEVKRYRIDNTADTPIIDGMTTVFTGQTKVQIGLKIEQRVESYLVNAGIALANKIKGEEA